MIVNELRADGAAERYDTRSRAVGIELADELPQVSGLGVDVVIEANMPVVTSSTAAVE